MAMIYLALLANLAAHGERSFAFIRAALVFAARAFAAPVVLLGRRRLVGQFGAAMGASERWMHRASVE